MAFTRDAWYQVICVIEDSVICYRIVFFKSLNETKRAGNMLRNLVECYQLAYDVLTLFDP